MTAPAHNSEYESVLLLLAREDAIFPLSTRALFHSQFSNERELNERLGGARLIYRSGIEREILRIDIQPDRKLRILKWFMNRLMRYHPIITHLSPPRVVDMAVLKARLEHFIVSQGGDAEPTFSLALALPDAVSSLRSSRSVEEIFSILQMPAPEDCLDVF